MRAGKPRCRTCYSLLQDMLSHEPCRSEEEVAGGGQGPSGLAHGSIVGAAEKVT